MKISNEQIIESARRQRQKVEGQMHVEPWQGRQMVNSKWLNGKSIAVAASLISFFAGYALHGGMPQSQPTENPVAQVVEVQHDTIMQVQTVRDTIYETRIVTKYEPMLAKAEASPTLEEEDDTSSEQKACSMLCDDIPYELLAAGR
ncbi:MAG: hypothetical protein IKQ07_02770 [Bacteroidaceae bacterium]|nr:hypothetical protein [Bacteroidaceae bacterium]